MFCIIDLVYYGWGVLSNLNVKVIPNKILNNNKQTLQKYSIKKVVEKRPIYYIVDDKINSTDKINNYIAVPHAYLVKAMADNILKGKAKFKLINVGIPDDSVDIKAITRALKEIFSHNKNKKILGVNLSIDFPQENKIIKNLDFKKPSYDNVLEVIEDNDDPFSDYNQSINQIKAMAEIVKLSDKGVKVSIAAGNLKDRFNIFSLTKFFTKQPENIMVAGALDDKGEKLKIFCNNENLITTWKRGTAKFLPVLDEKYKQILGLSLEGSHSISIRPKHFSNYYEVKVSNLFSGLTPKDAIKKVKELNSHGEKIYQISVQDKTYSIKYKYDEKIQNVVNPKTEDDFDIEEKSGSLKFNVNEDNILVSDLFKNLLKAKPKLKKGTSLSAPIALAEC